MIKLFAPLLVAALAFAGMSLGVESGGHSQIMAHGDTYVAMGDGHQSESNEQASCCDVKSTHCSAASIPPPHQPAISFDYVCDDAFFDTYAVMTDRTSETEVPPPRI